MASILLQLQSFFFEENAIPQDYGGARRNTALSFHDVSDTKRRASSFHCSRCGHGGFRSPYPSLSKGFKRPEPMGGRMVAGTIWHVDSMWEEATGQWSGFRHPEILTRGRSVFEVTVKREGYGASRGALQVGCTTSTNDHWLRLCCSTLGAVTATGKKKDTRRVARRISAGDTITCAVDFEAKVVHFAMNGRVVGEPVPLPEGMRSGQAVHAAVNIRSTRVAFNWRGPWRYPMEEFSHLLAIPALPGTGEEKEEEKKEKKAVVPAVLALPNLLLWAGGRARAFDRPMEQLQGLVAEQHAGYPLPEVLLLEIFEFLSSVELIRLPQVPSLTPPVPLLLPMPLPHFVTPSQPQHDGSPALPLPCLHPPPLILCRCVWAGLEWSPAASCPSGDSCAASTARPATRRRCWGWGCAWSGTTMGSSRASPAPWTC